MITIASFVLRNYTLNFDVENWEDLQEHYDDLKRKSHSL